MAITTNKTMTGLWIDSGVTSGDDYAIQCLTGEIAEAYLSDTVPPEEERGIAFTTRNGITSLSFGTNNVWLRGLPGTIVIVTT